MFLYLNKLTKYHQSLLHDEKNCHVFHIVFYQVNLLLQNLFNCRIRKFSKHKLFYFRISVKKCVLNILRGLLKVINNNSIIERFLKVLIYHNIASNLCFFIVYCNSLSMLSKIPHSLIKNQLKYSLN